MPFTALYKGNRIDSEDIKPKEWSKIKISERDRRNLVCPECKEQMIAKAGIESVITPHFAHARNLIEGEISKCSLRKKDKQKEHRHIQRWLFQVCQSLGLDVQREYEIKTPNGKRYADVCVPDKKKIIEVQLSGQTEGDYFERSNAYSTQGYESLWITWKKDIPTLPYARISIFNSKQKELKNKKNIIDAAMTQLLTPVLYYWVDQRSWRYQIDTVKRSVNLSDLTETFMFDTARYLTACDICDKPHWCGEKCRETKPKIMEKIREKRQNKIRNIRIFHPETYAVIQEKYPNQLGKYLKASRVYLQGAEEGFEDLINELTAEESHRKDAKRDVDSFISQFPDIFAGLKSEYPHELKSYLKGTDYEFADFMEGVRRDKASKEFAEKQRIEKEKLNQNRNAIVQKGLEILQPTEPDQVVIYNPNDDYIDYAGVRRSFNVRLHAPHLWRKPKSNNDQKES